MLLALLTATALVVGAATPAGADDDDWDDDEHEEDEDDDEEDDDEDEDKRSKITLLTKDTATVVAGDTAWLAVNWTAKHGAVQNVRLELSEDPGDGVQVSYPTNTATWTGLMNGHVLDESEIDYTAFRVHVPDSFDKKKVKLEFEVSYTDSRGEQRTDEVKITVPVVRYTDGDHLVQHEATATVPAGGSAWIDVDMTGLAPVTSELSLTAEGGLDVVYPGDGVATSLHGDDLLEDGETDTARFRVDAGDTAPGTYQLTTELTYVFEGAGYVLPGTVEIVIE